MYRPVFWTLWERERVGWFGIMALKHVYYHMWDRFPVQVRCMIQDARGWCTGMTQRDGMGREEGGGFRMGNTCTPVVDSCWCMAKPIQYCKVIMLQEGIRGQTHWNHAHRKLVNLITLGPQPSLTQWNQAMPAGQSKTGGSWWKGLTERGPLEKGMASHFSILALRTPWTVWKSKKIWHLISRCPICYWRSVEK